MFCCIELVKFVSGLVADIDIESEKFRWMGSARIDFYVRFLIENFDNCCIVWF